MRKKVWYAPHKFESYGEEEIEAVNKALKEGWLAGFGPYTTEFEAKIAKEFGSQCLVISIDVKLEDNEYKIFYNNGTKKSKYSLEEWINLT